MHYSRLYDNAPMPFSVQFHGNYFIHGFSEVPAWPASHGCIRVPMDGENPAQKFYDWVEVGTPIKVTGDWADFDIKANLITIGVEEGSKGSVLARQGSSRSYCHRLRVDTVSGEVFCDQLSKPAADQVAQVPQAPIVPLTVPSAMPAPGTANDAITKKAIEAISNGNCGGRPCLVALPKELAARASDAAKKNPKAAAEIEAAAKDAAKSVVQNPAVKRIVPKSTRSSWGATTAPNEQPAPPPIPAKPATN